MKKKSNRTKQLNTKMEPSMFNQIQEINEKLFGGELNNSDLGHLLFQVALDALSSGRVKKKTVLMVNDLPLEIK